MVKLTVMLNKSPESSRTSREDRLAESLAQLPRKDKPEVVFAGPGYHELLLSYALDSQSTLGVVKGLKDAINFVDYYRGSKSFLYVGPDSADINDKKIPARLKNRNITLNSRIF